MRLGVSEFSYKIENPNEKIPVLYDEDRIIVITILYNMEYHRDDVYTIDKNGFILFNGFTSKFN